MSLIDELYAAGAERRASSELPHRLLELTVIACALANLWAWVGPISRNPAVVAPLGLARYVDFEFMLSWPAACANAALGSALLGLGFWRVSRVAYLASLLVFHVQYVARFCLGKSGHGANLVGFALLAFGLGSFLFAERAEQQRAARGLLLLLVGLSYALAALCKLIATGPHWIDGNHLALWISEKALDNASSFGADPLNLVQHALLAHRGLGTALLAFGLLSELSGILLWWRRPRRLVLMALLGMHVGIMVAMDIKFFANMAILLCLLLTAPRPTGAQARLAVELR